MMIYINKMSKCAWELVPFCLPVSLPSVCRV